MDVSDRLASLSGSSRRWLRSALVWVWKTWSRRFLLLSLILVAIGIGTPDPASSIFAILSFLGFLCSAATGLPASWREDRAKKVRKFILSGLAFWLALFAVIYAFAVVISVLAFLAGSAVSFEWGMGLSRSAWLIVAELALVSATPLVLIYVPDRLHKRGFDINKAGAPLAAITLTTCILTGSYLLLLHIGKNGYFPTLSTGQLIVGIIFTMALLGPSYKALANACWQRGAARIFSAETVKEPWRTTIEEWRRSKRAGSLKDGHSAGSTAGAQEL